MSASSQILDAIELLTNNSIKKAAYDRTIQAQIISCEDETIGKYKCRYQDAIIYAYSTGTNITFNKGAQVYILVPGNNMKNEKTILGTTEKLGINYISQAEGDQAYDLVGNNCISSNKVIYLDTNYKNYNYTIYKKDDQNNLLTIDEISLKEYIKKSSSLIVGAYFQTKIPLERQFRGHYGIKMNLSFYDNATNEIIIRSCIIDQDNMVDNPYRLTQSTRQYQIFDIDGVNFKDLESIEIFCTDFPGANIENNILLENGDIIINSFQFIGANRMNEEEISGVALSLLTPQGTFFSNDLGSGDKSIIAQVKIKGKVASKAQKIQYYWGAQDNSVTPQSQYYNKYLGRGWKCLNDNNIILDADQTENSVPVIQWISGTDTYIMTLKQANAKDNRIKVAVLYDGNVITKEINIQNFNANIPEFTIESDAGTQFYYDIGHPTLTCKINNEQNLNYKYYWSYISNTGVFETLEDTNQQNIAYKEAVDALKTIKGKLQNGEIFANAAADELKICQDAVDGFNSIQRVDNNKIYNVQINRITFSGTFKCSVYDEQDENNKKYLGTAIITLTNKLEGEGVYSLVINNGSETFQYDENGVAPTSPHLQNPQLIQPLSFTIYDNLGQAIEEKSNRYKIKWEFPIKDTLLISKNNEDSEIESNEYYKYYNSPTLTYDINRSYNIKWQKNQIKLTVQYNNMTLVASTNFAFVKQGEPGTNGTSYVVKIIPNTYLSNPPILPMVTYQESSKQAFLNYGVGNYNIETNISNERAVAALKAQLWENGELIYEGTTGTEEYNLEWEILRNQYTKNIFDDSDFAIDKETGLISYNKKSLTATSHIPSANIIQCSFTIDNKKYYGTIPIVTAWVINSNYRIKLKDQTGFKYVIYSNSGLSPSFDNSTPFQFTCLQKINNIWEDVSLVKGKQQKKFEFFAIGNYKIITFKTTTEAKIEDSKLLKLQTNNSNLEKNQQKYTPASRYDGVCVNEAVVCSCSNNNDVVVAKINVPIHFLLNRNSLANINEWDGNSIQLNEDNGFILSPQVGAGFKEDDNSFTGIIIGSEKAPVKSEEGEDKKTNSIDQKIGLLGYHKGQRTIFLNSENGSAIFGKFEGGQIIIDPNANKALLYSNSFWKTYNNNGLPSSYSPTNQNSGEDAKGMIIDLSTPEIRFANGNFSVNDKGELTAKGKGKIAGWIIDGDTLKSSSKNLTLDSSGNGSIYSINHNQLSSRAEGFFLSNEGLSIGDKVKITSDGKAYFGYGASTGGGTKYWTIDGTSSDSYISYSGTTFKSSTVYLGTNGISLGQNNFSVDSSGSLFSKSGNIGGWTIGTNQLSSASGGTVIQSDGTIHSKNSEWEIKGDGSAKFTKGTFGPWTVNTGKNAFQGSADEKNSILLWANGNIRGRDISEGSKTSNYWQIWNCEAFFSNGVHVGPTSKTSGWHIGQQLIYNYSSDSKIQFGPDKKTITMGYKTTGTGTPAIYIGGSSLMHVDTGGNLYAQKGTFSGAATFHSTATFDTKATFSGDVAFAKAPTINNQTLVAWVKSKINEDYIKSFITKAYIQKQFTESTLNNIVRDTKGGLTVSGTKVGNYTTTDLTYVKK